jgi:hypothetical protein
MDPKEEGWEGVGWISLTEDFCEHGNELSGSMELW